MSYCDPSKQEWGYLSDQVIIHVLTWKCELGFKGYIGYVTSVDKPNTLAPSATILAPSFNRNLPAFEYQNNHEYVVQYSIIYGIIAKKRIFENYACYVKIDQSFSSKKMGI